MLGSPVGSLVKRAVIFALVFCWWAPLRGETIAVLPLYHETGIDTFDWMGESIAEAVRETLDAQGLLALNREDRVEVYRRLSVRPGAVLTRATVIKIGQTLDAGKVIYGFFTVTPAGQPGHGAISITARLLDLQHMKPGPEFHESGQLADLSVLQQKLGWQFLHYLAPQSAPTEQAFLASRPPVRLDAVESYIRGLLAASPDQQLKLFTQAAHLDAGFSQPCFQLGRMLFGRKNYKEAGQWLERVMRGDSHFMEARYLLGICRFYAGDYEAAVNLFQEVAAQVPLNEVYNNLGAAQLRRNDNASVSNFRKALEGDDSDPDYWFNVGYALWKQGDFRTAAANFRAVLARTPDDLEATILLARCLRNEGPTTADTKLAGRERLKQTFEETALRQLQAELKK
jgi:Tfp pilus assembly protein PilF